MTYGWAQRRIFGRTEDAVRIVREQAEQCTSKVSGPRSLKQVILTPIEFVSPSVRARYAARGWPPELIVEGAEARDAWGTSSSTSMTLRVSTQER